MAGRGSSRGNTGLADRLEHAAGGAGERQSGGQLVAEDALRSPEVKARLIQQAARTIDVDRLLSIVLGQVRANRQLAECTWVSLIAAVRDLAQLGLYPGPLGHAYLVPFMNNKVTPRQRECTLILGYKGMIELARRSGALRDIRARAVYERDTFEFSQGLEDVLRHVPAFELADRGALRLVYAVAKFENGGAALMVMSKAEVDAIRARARAKDDGPWVTDYERMACKTVVRQLGNRGELPLTHEAADAFARDEARELGYAAAAGIEGADVIAGTATEVPTPEPAGNGKASAPAAPASPEPPAEKPQPPSPEAPPPAPAQEAPQPAAAPPNDSLPSDPNPGLPLSGGDS